MKLFATHGYRPLDIVRGHIWEDESIHWWLRQNCIMFCSEQAIEANEQLKKDRDVKRPLSVVHPNVYLTRMQFAALGEGESADHGIVEKRRPIQGGTPAGRFGDCHAFAEVNRGFGSFCRGT